MLTKAVVLSAEKMRLLVWRRLDPLEATPNELGAMDWQTTGADTSRIQPGIPACRSRRHLWHILKQVRNIAVR